jgi:hypothetical protein
MSGPTFPGTGTALWQDLGSIQKPAVPAPPRGIGVPTNKSVGSKKGDTPAGAIAGILELDAAMLSIGLEQRSFKKQRDSGLEDCLAQAKKKGGCGGCCLINLYLLRGKYDSYRRVFHSSSEFFSQPCFKVQADRAAMTGQVYEPYFGRLGYPGVGDDPVLGWFYRLLNQDAREVFIDDQNYLPQYIDIDSSLLN